MANSSFCRNIRSVTCSCLFTSCLVLLFCSLSEAQRVPAMYVFGDSLVDVGNNNYLRLSVLRADFPHNGIDYPGKKATGRFSNGKNAADFIAEKLGLPTAPAYLSQPNNVFLKGVSFASGGAGIFNATDDGRLIRPTISMPQQVGQFSTVRQGLLKELGSTAAVQQHLANSLFPIVIGSNDIINYFSTGSQMKNPQQYVTQMVSAFKDLLKGTYGLGARKFLVIGLSPIGCAPQQRHRSSTDECNTQVNYWSNKYNQDLAKMLQEVKTELRGLQYSYFDTYGVFIKFIESPATYGFKEIKSACCGLGRLRAKVPCTPVSLYCSDRSGHLFWDIYHPTEAAARTFVDILFSGSGDYVHPMTVQQLIEA